jgi:hypothetical protein
MTLATNTVENEEVAPEARRRRSVPRQGWVPVGLVALSLVPALAGSVRLVELAGDPEVTARNARFVASPLPVVAHIISALLFSLIGAFQFAPALRRRRWHRLAGRVVAPAGLVAAASGAWMTASYDLPPSDTAALNTVRYVVAAAMGAALLLGLQAARARRFARHGAWMTRAYALGLGAGTQVLTTVAWLLPFGEPAPDARAALMTAGWAINVVVAERAIRRRGQPAR